MSYWPWWAGAIGLALVTIAYTVLTDRSLGISSAWDRVVHWRSERRIEQLDAEFADEKVLADALAVATAEQFGSGPAVAAPADTAPADTAPVGSPSDRPGGARHARVAECGAPPSARRRPAPLVTQAVLLVSVFLGGLLAAATSGHFQLRLDMGEGFRQIVTGNPVVMVVILFVGGILVGFGTRLAGGCSSGHGLSGCGRLQPVSILATAVFFGTAVVVSFLLWKVI